MPTVVALAGLAAWPYRGRKALIPPVALSIAMAAMLAGALHLAGPTTCRGKVTTTARSTARPTDGALLRIASSGEGLPFALALIGIVAYALRPSN